MEQEPEPNFELQPSESLTPQEVLDVTSEYLDEDDLDFINEQLSLNESPMDVDDVINYVYGRLIQAGKDADEILESLGLFENN